MCSSFFDLSELSLPRAQPSPLLLVCSSQRSDQIWTELRLFPSTVFVQARDYRKWTRIDSVDPSFGIFLLLKPCIWFDRFSFGSRSCILMLSSVVSVLTVSLQRRAFGYDSNGMCQILRWPLRGWNDRASHSNVRSAKSSCNEMQRSICRYLPDLRGILLDLTDALEGRAAPRIIAEPTKTKPFQLTAPKPRAVPIPKIVR